MVRVWIAAHEFEFHRVFCTDFIDEARVVVYYCLRSLFLKLQGIMSIIVCLTLSVECLTWRQACERFTWRDGVAREIVEHCLVTVHVLCLYYGTLACIYHGPRTYHDTVVCTSIHVCVSRYMCVCTMVCNMIYIYTHGPHVVPWYTCVHGRPTRVCTTVHVCVPRYTCCIMVHETRVRTFKSPWV